MDDEIISKARASEWGFVDLREGQFLFMRLDSERVVLIEPFGGYYFPFHERIHPVPMPDAKALASALSGVSCERLDAVAEFACEPRTMLEIDTQFVGVEAWRLRRLVDFIFEMAKSGRRSSYIPTQPNARIGCKNR